MQRKRLQLFIAGLFTAGSIIAHAVMLEIDVEADVKVTSAYVWRGMVINDELCIQPSVTVRAGDVSFNVWGIWDLTDVTNSSEHTRMDTTLDYTHAYGKQILGSGLTAYIYHDDPGEQSKDTFEVFLGYTLDIPSLPSLTVYYDFGEIEGFYASFALAHSFELVKNRIALDLGVALNGGDQDYSSALVNLLVSGEAVEEFEFDEASLVDVTAVASFPVSFGDYFEITPGVKYMELLDSKIKDAVRNIGGEEDQWVYSLTATLYF